MATQALRDEFRRVSRFLDDPEGTILRAREQRDPDGRFSRIQAHRADVSLKLNIVTFLKVQDQLNQFSLRVVNFRPGVDTGPMALVSDFAGIAKSVVACRDHLANCQDVLQGRTKRLLRPKGPDIGA